MTIVSPPGFGTPISSDLIGSVHYPIVKLASGDSGTANIIGPSNPLPIRADTESAYGEITTVSNRPIIQALPTYNLLPANWRTYTAGTGTATVANKMFTCQTGTTIYSYGVIRSVRSVNYHAGVGAYGKFAARFSTGIANSQQAVGFFNIGDGYLFGFNGAEFGILYQHGGKPEVRTITVTGASGGSTNLTLTLNSVGYTIPLTSGTTAFNAYEITTWLNANQTIWSAKQNGSTVVLMAFSEGAKSGTYTYSHSTSTGTIAATTTGITKTTDFYAQTAWNKDTVSWLEPTYGNTYAIQYHGLGFGGVEFFVQNPDTGRFIPVHLMDFANTTTTAAVMNPSMRIGMYNYSLGSTTNLVTYCAGMSAFTQGDPQPIRNPRSTSNIKTLTTTLTNLLTIRCRETFGGEPNQLEIQPLLITAFTESNKGATVTIYTNATVGGTPNFSYLDEDTLISEIDTAGTTVTGGNPLASFVITTNTVIIDLNALNIRIPPTITLTIAAKVNSGAAADTGVSISWYEDV